METIDFKFPQISEFENPTDINIQRNRAKNEFFFLCDIIAKSIAEEAESEVYIDFNQVIYSELGLLYILPVKSPNTPVIDEITRKLTWLWHQKLDVGMNNFGTHTCSCGAKSDTIDYLLVNPNGKFILTNSLCMHYVSVHRSEIVLNDWIKIIGMLYPVTTQDNPTQQELCLI